MTHTTKLPSPRPDFVFRLVCLIVLISLPSASWALTDENKSIPWQDWSIAPFQQAKEENKIILLNVGMEGCDACARMESITYADPAVIRLVNEHFVSIAVDSEARPDIGERYSDWAWPATIFLAPDTTQVLAIRGNRLPRNFIPILNDLISRHASGELEPDPRSPYASPPAPQDTELSLIRDTVRVQIDRTLNHKYGGWGSSGIGGEQSGSRLRHLYFRAYLYDNPELLELAMKGSEGYLLSIDPVWGGVYSRSFPADMEMASGRFSKLRAVPEKRISAQSNAMVGFAIGYQLSGDQRFVEAMQDMHRFMSGQFMAPDGTFYTNQRAEPVNLPSNMTAGDYWSLPTDEARREYGFPAIDHAVYTDKNGEAISAYVMAWEAFGDITYLHAAEKAAKAILKRRSTEAGWVIQAVEDSQTSEDKRLRPLDENPRPFLNAQAWFGQGLLALYRATGEQHWLDAATRIGNATLESLQDDELGGFYATTADETAMLIAPRKPLEANGTAANFFYDLWVYSKDETFAAIPEQTLRAVAQPDIVRREGKITGELAMALEKVTAAYVEFSVVGDPDLPASNALYDAGLQTYHPRKILHYEAPGRYPQRENPAMYICNPDMCSIPIEDPALVKEQALIFRGPASS